MNYFDTRRKEHEGNDLWKKDITMEQAEYIFERLKNHYHINEELRFTDRTNGLCGEWEVLLPLESELGTLIHEVGHGIQFKKGRVRGKKLHTKKLLSIENRIMRYVAPRIDLWLSKVAQKGAKSLEMEKAREQREIQVAAYKSSPQGRIDMLRNQEKEWMSKQKRVENKLKKIRRRIRIWEKKNAKSPNGSTLG